MRAFLIVLNGVGAGAAPDAAKYGDDGANTLGRLYEHCAHLELPTLISMGLGEIVGATPDFVPAASRGRMRPRSKGKDTTTAHWELAGVISQESFTSYERFPDSLVREIETAAKVKFIGNDRRGIGALHGALCNEHLKTGHPILEALPDSTMVISAHEKVVPRSRLYEIARIARRHCNTHRIKRVVAQPFAGEQGNVAVTTHEREFPAIPPRTVLNAISETGLHVDMVGSAGGFFARSGITRQHLTRSNEETLGAVDHIRSEQHDGLVFASLENMGVSGQLRKLRGFAEELQKFDQWLGDFLEGVYHDDLVIITGDQGCDPTFPGAGPTREEVPLLVRYDAKAENLGVRLTLADVAATLASFFQLREPWRTGTPFFKFPKLKAR